MAVRGVANENEFFSEHYLSARFESDLRVWEREAGLEAASADRPALVRLFQRSREAYAQATPGRTLPRACGEFQIALLDALGYERRYEPHVVALGNAFVSLPVLCRVTRASAADALWIVEAREPVGTDAWGQDPLALSFAPARYPAAEPPLPSSEWTVERAVEAGIYGQSRPPRFVLVMSLAQWVLLDREKWAEGRQLRFDPEEVLARADAWRAARGLLHRQSLVPYGNVRGLERFNEESRRHAQGVSADLKYALREAVEILGNAVVARTIAERRRQGRAIWTGSEALRPERVTRECLRFLYRLLFLFYAEAQPELAPPGLRDLVYRAGYSLESLRELEMQPLPPGGADTFFLHESLQTLFGFLRDGTPLREHRSALAGAEEGVAHHEFQLAGFRTALFHELPLLDRQPLPDRVLQRVIALLSLSRAGKRGRGRISYAQLGVHELGSVYEALLSFNGFFTSEDLIEVKRKDEDNPDPLARAWFAPLAQADAYGMEEIRYENNAPRVYPRESFVYRLTGYERETHASYYTPQVLTSMTVRLAVEELLTKRAATADAILELRICEPAMGSAAFLIEAVNQLAEIYLQRKQKELGRAWEPARLTQMRQRVRAHITARNAFGVDLNGEARAMGEISLWLNGMEAGGFLPELQHTLQVGNSLIGGRRETVAFVPRPRRGRTEYRPSDARPRRLAFAERRADDAIYHFLVPVPEMLEVKLARETDWLLPPETSVQSRTWRKQAAQAWDDREMGLLCSLSATIDELWRETVEEKALWRELYEEALSDVLAGSSAAHAEPTDPFQSEAHDRLQLAMDYWCSLWFWPLDALAHLPARGQFLEDMSLILTGHWGAEPTGLSDMFRMDDLEETERQAERTLLERRSRRIPFAELDVALGERYRVVKRITAQERFFHWELAFADIFAEAGGFDLIVGNPPWTKLDWKDAELLSQFDPAIIIRKLSADQVARRKKAILDTDDKRKTWVAAFRSATGRTAFFKHPYPYPDMAGIPNTYKAFLLQGFRLVKTQGMVGFVHPVDHLKDPRGRALRRACYQRQIWLLQFANARFLFADIAHRTTFAVGLYGGQARAPRFRLMANLFDPRTITESLLHDGAGPVPGIKDDNNQWELRGHHSRIIKLDAQALQRLGSVLDPDVPAEAVRLPLLHSQELADSLVKMTRVPDRLGDLEGSVLQDSMWHETGDRKPPDPVFQRRTDFYDDPREMILQGPNFGLSTPWAKCPRAHCRSKGDYDVIDLTIIPDDYLPRVNYTPVIPWAAYRNQVRRVPWDSGKCHLDFYRLFLRKRMNASSERSLQCAIFGSGFAHVMVCESLAFRNLSTLIQVCALWNSLPYDFLVRSYQLTDILWFFTSQLPLVDLPSTALHRTLQLNCLTLHNASLWNELAPDYAPLPWAGNHPCLDAEGPRWATPQWQRQCALRRDYVRRQSLLEIDVLVAMALDLSLDELIQIYRLVFPVMRNYEENTWYDQQGRIVWSPITGKGLKMPRSEWERHRALPQGCLAEDVEDNFLSDGPHVRTIEYQAPFTQSNREQDYRQAWTYFENRI